MYTIVMTGGSSGFGLYTVKELTNNKANVLLGARDKVDVSGIKSFDLDLSSLKSVRSFAEKIRSELQETKIDALILNAGLSLPSIERRTEEGFEMTVGVNHLAHFLLLQLLLPNIKEGGIISITTSGTHNPKEKTIIPPPRHADIQLLVHPEKDLQLNHKPLEAGGHAYSSSKLCNILTARKLKHLYGNRFRVIAYDPGPIPGTGLSRHNSTLVKIIWKVLSFRVIRILMPKFNSKQLAGKTLANIALGKINIDNITNYLVLRKGEITFPNPSDLALNDSLADKVWNESGQLVGTN